MQVFVCVIAFNTHTSALRSCYLPLEEMAWRPGLPFISSYFYHRAQHRPVTASTPLPPEKAAGARRRQNGYRRPIPGCNPQ